MKTIHLYTKGATTTDPGPAAVGVSLTDDKGVVLHEVKESIGNSAAEYAEYFAILRALQLVSTEYADEVDNLDVTLHTTSELAYEQLQHIRPVVEPAYVPLFIEIHNMRVQYVPKLSLVLLDEATDNPANTLVTAVLDVA